MMSQHAAMPACLTRVRDDVTAYVTGGRSLRVRTPQAYAVTAGVRSHRRQSPHAYAYALRTLYARCGVRYAAVRMLVRAA
jgi:hypothetical protein